MSMAVARVSVGSASAVPTLLVALLACTAARIAVVDGGTACDGVSCGMGTCKEVPPLLPMVPNVTYECDCDVGWAWIVPILTFSPCYIPSCPSYPSCYSPTFKRPPIGSNVTLHPCLAMDCGQEGTCVEEQGKPFRCQCNPGAENMLNNPSLPCTKNCVIGKDGCPVKNPPPAPPPLQSLQSPPPLSSAAASPDIGHDSSGPTAPSSAEGNQTNTTSPGSVCLPNLLLPLLLLVSFAALYIV